MYVLQALLEQSEAAPSAAQGVEDASAGDVGWQGVAQLLGRKHDRVDPVQALPLLPLQVPYIDTYVYTVIYEETVTFAPEHLPCW